MSISGYEFSKQAARKWHQWVNPFSRYAPNAIRLPWIPSANGETPESYKNVQYDPNVTHTINDVNISKDYHNKIVSSETAEQTKHRESSDMDGILDEYDRHKNDPTHPSGILNNSYKQGLYTTGRAVDGFINGVRNLALLGNSAVLGHKLNTTYGPRIDQVAKEKADAVYGLPQEYKDGLWQYMSPNIHPSNGGIMAYAAQVDADRKARKEIDAKERQVNHPPMPRSQYDIAKSINDYHRAVINRSRFMRWGDLISGGSGLNGKPSPNQTVDNINKKQDSIHKDYMADVADANFINDEITRNAKGMTDSVNAEVKRLGGENVQFHPEDESLRDIQSGVNIMSEGAGLTLPAATVMSLINRANKAILEGGSAVSAGATTATNATAKSPAIYRLYKLLTSAHPYAKGVRGAALLSSYAINPAAHAVVNASDKAKDINKQNIDDKLTYKNNNVEVSVGGETLNNYKDYLKKMEDLGTIAQPVAYVTDAAPILVPNYALNRIALNEIHDTGWWKNQNTLKNMLSNNQLTDHDRKLLYRIGVKPIIKLLSEYIHPEDITVKY